MRFFIDTKPAPVFYALAVAGIAIAVGMTNVFDYDVWWHLKTGELIWTLRAIPKFDVYSWTALGAPWHNPEWLFELIIFGIYKHFGFTGVVIFKFFLSVLVGVVVFKTICYLTKSPATAMWGVFFFLWVIGNRILERSYLFSLLFMAWFIFEMYRYIDGRVGNLLWLVLIQIFWVNLHGGAVVGPQLVLIVAFAETVQWLLPRFLKDCPMPSPVSGEKIRHLWLIGFACAAATLINPYGIDAYAFSFEHLKMRAILNYTQEWLPVLDPAFDKAIPQMMFNAMIPVSIISFFVNRKKLRLSYLALMVLASLLVLKGKRFIPDYMIAVLPLMLYNFKEAAGHLKLTPGFERARAWGNIFAVTMLSFIVVGRGLPVTFDGMTLGTMGVGAEAQSAPTGLIAFLEDNNIHGRVFNEMGLGGYLIFTRWPREAVFIDGRTPLYGDDFYKDFVDVFHNSRAFGRLYDKFKFDYLVFKAYQAWDLREMHRWLWESPDWKLVYAECGEGFVYLHNEPKFAKLIKKFALKKHPVVEAMEQTADRRPQITD